MSLTDTATPVLPRAIALTTLVYQDYHEEGFQGVIGRCHVSSSVHPYAFVSREAAARLGNLRALQDHCDSFHLHTPGYVPPPPPDFDDAELPF